LKGKGEFYKIYMVIHMENLAIQFGNRLRTMRTEKKMSQEELSFRAGISAAHLGQIERAEKKPTLETIGKLAEALEISLPELFAFEANSNDSETGTEDIIISKINSQLKGLTWRSKRISCVLFGYFAVM